MFLKPILACLAASALFSASGFSGESALIIQPDGAEKSSGFDVPDFDVAQARFLQTGAMDFEGGPGDLSISQYGFRAFLTKPIELADGLIYLPMFTYFVTSLDFENTPTFPLIDEELHATSIHSFFIKTFRDSPWFGVAWNRVEFSTDYQNPSGDAFTFDAALAVGYKFSDTFSLSLGGAVTGINSEVTFIPGINFDWEVSEKIRVGIYGPSLLARYEVNEDWNLSIRGAPTGGTWVFDDSLGRSRTIELSSYALGLYTENEIYEGIWLTAGAGYTIGNEIERRGNGGRGGNSADLESAPFVLLGLGIRSW